MKIFNENLEINIDNEKILINDDELLGNEIFKIEKIRFISRNLQSMNIDYIKHSLTRNEAITLLGLSYNIKSFIDIRTNEKYELTFSYHFPLKYETRFIDIMIKNFEFVYKGHLLNFATYGEFIRVDLNNKLEQLDFNKKFSYLVRHNDKITEINHNEIKVSTILNNWNKYCIKKFNKEFSKEELDSYNFFYNLENFHTIQYQTNKEIISEGIAYFSKETKTLYYCIFWWNNKYKSLSPGIYNYAKTILYCIKKEIAFSFCYGFQDYKLNMLKSFKNSNSLQHWSKIYNEERYAEE